MRLSVLLAASLSLIAFGCAHSEPSQEQTTKRVGPYLIFDKQAEDLFDLEANVEELASGFIWTEGPLWLESQNCLLFSDIPNRKVMRYCPDKGLDTYLEDSGFSNGLILGNAGELVLMQSRSRRVASMTASLAEPKPDYKTLASHYQDKRLNSPNDVTMNKAGDLYFTDPPYGLPKQLDDPNKELSFQGVYRLSTDGKLTLLDSTLKYPNGIELIGDSKRVIVAVSDPENPSWYIYDVDESGLLSNRQSFASASDYTFERGPDGLPDGLKEHASGAIFATGPGGVWVFNSEGRLLAHLSVEGPVANLAFDASQKTLYLTAESKLLSVQLK